MSENKNMDAFKHKIAISGYVEAILGKKQILQDKKTKTPFHRYPAKYVKKFKSINSSLSVTVFLAEASWSPN